MSTILSNPDGDVKDYQPRFLYMYAIVAVIGLALLARLWFLQIIEGEELRTFSERNRVKETKIRAPRGLILDREGRVLVDNLPGFEATITPQYATKLEDTAAAASEILGIKSKKIVDEIKKGHRRDGPFRPVRIKDNLSLEEVFRLKLLRWDHPGLNINESVLRHYPLVSNGSQVFGYVGEIAREQLERIKNQMRSEIAYEAGDIIGQSGLEQTWEKELRGDDGVSYVEVDARGREASSDTPRFFGLQPRDPVPGHSLELTLDKDIQEAAHRAMFRDDKTGPRIGSVLAMKANGEILAWVNTPSFDSNEFTTGITHEMWVKLTSDPFKPLRNKVIQDHFPPGSTFKPVVALAALEEKIIAANTVIHSPASLKFGRRIYHDHTRGGHGYVTVLEALERSSNIFFYRMGISLGIERMAPYARAIGLGQKTEIQLPHEAPGLIPTPEWKKKVFGEEWQPGENLSNAIGQGFILATTLQMALAYNTIGLEGPVVQPYLVRRILDPTNKVIQEITPQVIRDVSSEEFEGVKISKQTFRTVKEGLRRVANGSGGTARWWKVPGIEFAGKTGTSQVRSFSADEIYDKCENRPLTQRHHGWFVGFAPVDKPEITVAVLTQHACHGSTGSVPVVRDIIHAYMSKYHPEKLKTSKPTAPAPIPQPEPEEEE